jgi:hypothetical protein
MTTFIVDRYGKKRALQALFRRQCIAGIEDPEA